jgi:hypothetical protein
MVSGSEKCILDIVAGVSRCWSGLTRSLRSRAGYLYYLYIEASSRGRCRTHYEYEILQGV